MKKNSERIYILPDVIRDRRKAIGMTLEAAGLKMGWASPAPQWRSHELKPHYVSPDTAASMAIVLQCTIEELSTPAPAKPPTQTDLMAAYEQGRADERAALAAQAGAS